MFLQRRANHTWLLISASELTRCQWRQRAAAGPLFHLTTISQLQQHLHIATTQQSMSKKTMTRAIIEKGASVL